MLKWILGVFVVGFSLLSFADQKVSGTMYDLKSNQQKKLFNVVVLWGEKNGVITFDSKVTQLDGKLAVEELGQVKGTELKSYEVLRPQTQQSGKIEVIDGNVHFEFVDKSGEKKTAKEKLSGYVLCNANFIPFLKAHWDELLAGKAIDVRYAVWDRLETVGFTLKFQKKIEVKGEKLVEFQMKPTSFVIAAIVDPVNVLFSEKDKSIQILKGRVVPKIQVNGAWKDLDAEVVYTYDQSVVSK